MLIANKGYGVVDCIYVSEQGPVTGSCEKVHEYLGFIKRHQRRSSSLLRFSGYIAARKDQQEHTKNTENKKGRSAVLTAWDLV